VSNIRKKVLAFAAVFVAIFLLPQTDAYAYNNFSSMSRDFDIMHTIRYYEYVMPKDGQIRFNANVKNIGSVPGTLTISITKDYLLVSETVIQFTDISDSTPVTDTIIDLKKGTYGIRCELENDSGDLTYTAISLYCSQEILPTVPENISLLKVNRADSFEEIVRKDYEELKFGDGENTDIIIPFKVKNGDGLYISLGEKNGGFNYIQGSIYKDKECTTPVGKSFRFNYGDEYQDYFRSLAGAGTYYIKFTSNNYDAVGVTSFLVKLYEVNSNARTMTSGKSTLAYQDKEGKKIRYKVTVKSKSILGVVVTPFVNSGGGYATFSLLDKDGKVISRNSEVYARKDDDNKEYISEKMYTVPAGTYYVQVTSSCNLYQLKYIDFGIVKNAGATKSKAKTLKVMQTQGAGYFLYTDKTSVVDWYKFTLSSNQYVKLYMQYYLDGYFDYEILNAKGKVLYKLSEQGDITQGNIVHWCSNTYSKGTYYIKVYKKGKSSSLTYKFALFDSPYEEY
jgi:hypothetical protein